MQIFAEKCDVHYKGGFVMGLGALLDGRPVDKLPHGKKVVRQLHIFFDHISKGEESPRHVYEDAQLKLPSFVSRIMAKKMNRDIDRNLSKYGIEVNRPSPYLEQGEI